MSERKISLRAIEPEDLDLLYKIENDMSVWNAGATNVPYSRYVLMDYIANTTSDIYADKQLRLIIENEEGMTVGMVDLVNFDPRHMRAEVGIIIRSEFRGRGYARDALTALLGYSRDILHLHQVYAYSDIRNEVSIRLFETLGFSGTTLLKDWLRTSTGYVDVMFMQYFL